MQITYLGKDLIEGNIKKLKVIHTNNKSRKLFCAIDVNDFIVRNVYKIKVKPIDSINKVLLIFKDKLNIEVGRISLFSTSEIHIDSEFGTYKIIK